MEQEELKKELDDVLIEHNADLLRISRESPFLADDGRRYRSITDLRWKTSNQIFALIKEAGYESAKETEARSYTQGVLDGIRKEKKEIKEQLDKLTIIGEEEPRDLLEKRPWIFMEQDRLQIAIKAQLQHTISQLKEILTNKE